MLFRMLRDLPDERRPRVPEGTAGPQSGRPLFHDLLTSFERDIIVAALFAAGGNQKRAAKALGVLPTTFQEKLKRFGLLNRRFGRGGRSGARAAGPSDESTRLVAGASNPTGGCSE